MVLFVPNIVDRRTLGRTVCHCKGVQESPNSPALNPEKSIGDTDRRFRLNNASVNVRVSGTDRIPSSKFSSVLWCTGEKG